jgi:hypothetical protein
MAHPRTQPMLAGWTPLQEPSRRLSPGELGSWLWPATVLAAFAAVAAYVAGTSLGPGISPRGLVTLALAVIVLAVLTVRRRWGPLAVLRTLAEYAVVAALAGLVVLAAAPPAERPSSGRHRAGSDLPAGHPAGGRRSKPAGRCSRLGRRAVAPRRRPDRPPHPPAVDHPAPG